MSEQKEASQGMKFNLIRADKPESEEHSMSEIPEASVRSLDMGKLTGEKKKE